MIVEDPGCWNPSDPPRSCLGDVPAGRL